MFNFLNFSSCFGSAVSVFDLVTRRHLSLVTLTLQTYFNKSLLDNLFNIDCDENV